VIPFGKGRIAREGTDLAKMLLDALNGAGSEVFDLPATHQELASRLGTVREVVSRNRGRFRAQGLIKI
jgi:CRP/FNR family transcriptional regulator